MELSKPVLTERSSRDHRSEFVKMEIENPSPAFKTTVNLRA